MLVQAVLNKKEELLRADVKQGPEFVELADCLEMEVQQQLQILPYDTLP